MVRQKLRLKTLAQNHSNCKEIMFIFILTSALRIFDEVYQMWYLKLRYNGECHVENGYAILQNKLQKQGLFCYEYN